MLPRTLEPEVMDSSEEATDYDAMDHHQVNELFVQDLLAAVPNPQDVLDIGTGTAQIPVLLCKQRTNCRILAIDMAISMLELARYNIEAAGVIQQVQLAQMDAKQLTFPEEMFDLVMSNSIIHHIPDPEPVVAEITRVLRPGGHVFIRDLLRPDDEETCQHLVETYTGQSNAHQQEMFCNSLRAALTLEEIRQMVRKQGWAPETVQQTSDRHWTWSAVKPFSISPSVE